MDSENCPKKLKVETWPIDRLVEYARNPRKNDEQVERMKAAIREFGFRIPVVAKSDGTLVDGHLRLKAARALGLTEVPVALADELTETQVKAFRLLANQSANWASWDNDLLKLEIEELEEQDFDVDMIGFDGDTLEAIGTAELDANIAKLKSEEGIGEVEDIGQFAVTFCFNDEDREAVDAAIDKKGKPYFVALLVKAMREIAEGGE